MNVRRVTMQAITLLFAFGLYGADEGIVKGSVKYDGEPPEFKGRTLDVNQQKDCKCKEVENEDLVVDKSSHGIKWAIVRIDGVTKAPPKEGFKTPEIDQKSCQFKPHVVVVAPDTELTFLNPDLISHNIHTTPTDGINTGINPMMTGEKKTIKGNAIKEPELIKVECNMHTWMRGWIVVHDPRFAAVTGNDGTFEIKEVPAGKYKVRVFQDVCGEKEFDVEVKSGQAADMGEIKLSVPKKKKD